VSYDISLIDKNGETIILDVKHQMIGGIYQVGGSQDAWLNVTYNYSKIFYRLFGDKGIRILYGMTGKASILILAEAIKKLNPETESSDYWAATEGNARKALSNLLKLAQLAPEGIWDGD
jgi:hypothetical protein